MTDLFIASRRIDHDRDSRKRRVVVAGALIDYRTDPGFGGSPEDADATAEADGRTCAAEETS